MEDFLRLAQKNTAKNLETCGVLAGSLVCCTSYIVLLFFVIISKVFYQQRHVKKIGNYIAREDSVHLVEDSASPNKQEDSKTENDIKIDIIQTPAQEVEIIKKIPHTSPSGSLSMLETEFPSWFAALNDDSGEICKPSSSCKGDMLSGIAGMTELENNRVDSPVYSDFFEGILVESFGTDSSDHVFTLVDGMIDNGKTGISSGNCEELAADEDGDRSVASVEDQLRKEMTVYEKFITGMLTNFGSMALDRIHNTLKMFCIADPTYDKSLQQLQSFLSGLVAEEKLELRDGMYLGIYFG